MVQQTPINKNPVVCVAFTSIIKKVTRMLCIPTCIPLFHFVLVYIYTTCYLHRIRQTQPILISFLVPWPLSFFAFLFRRFTLSTPTLPFPQHSPNLPLLLTALFARIRRPLEQGGQGSLQHLFINFDATAGRKGLTGRSAALVIAAHFGSSIFTTAKTLSTTVHS